MTNPDLMAVKSRVLTAAQVVLIMRRPNKKSKLSLAVTALDLSQTNQKRSDLKIIESSAKKTSLSASRNLKKQMLKR